MKKENMKNVNMNTFSLLAKRLVLSSLKISLTASLHIVLLFAFCETLIRVVMWYFNLSHDSIAAMNFFKSLFIDHFLPVYLFVAALAGNLLAYLFERYCLTKLVTNEAK